MSPPDPQVPDPEPFLPPTDAGNVEEGEEGECGFCLFMKGSGCKDAFIDWEKCIEEAEKNKEDMVEKWFQATAALKKCMEAHLDYYEPILRAKNVAKEAAARDSEERVEVFEVPAEQSPDSQGRVLAEWSLFFNICSVLICHDCGHLKFWFSEAIQNEIQGELHHTL